MKIIFSVLCLLVIGISGWSFTLAQEAEAPYIPNLRDNRVLQKAETKFDTIANEGGKEHLVYIIWTLKTQLGILKDPQSQYLLFELARLAEEQLPHAIDRANNPDSETGALADQNTWSTVATTTWSESTPPASWTNTWTWVVFETGKASYYAGKFDGRNTANGDTFDNAWLTAAHKTLPFNTRVKVVNLKNDHRVIVRINDRGPFTPGRVIDLSQEAFKAINNDSLSAGILNVTLEILE
jgi:rare lipoprotein A